MSTVGPVLAFTAGIATAATATSAIDLGGSYGKVLIGIPTMTSATDHYVQVSDKIDGTFRRVYHAPTVAVAKPTVVQIDSSVSNCFVPVELGGRFAKIQHSSATTSSSHIYTVICSTN